MNPTEETAKNLTISAVITFLYMVANSLFIKLDTISILIVLFGTGIFLQTISLFKKLHYLDMKED